MTHITEARETLFKRVISNTQNDLTVILENVHDPHNIGAVLRSCDAVGVRTIYILDTHDNLKERVLKQRLSTSTGVSRWIEIHRYTDLEECVSAVRQKHSLIIGTHLDKKATSLYKTDLTQSVAIAFGNEHQGMTDELIAHCDANLIIPQMGMVQSLNISVACAVTLFEAARQRLSDGKYDGDFKEEDVKQQAQYNHYLEIQKNRGLKE